MPADDYPEYSRMTGQELRRAELYRPPDPATWDKGKAVKISDTFIDERDREAAASLIAQEASTLSEKESIRLRTRLDDIHTRIWARCGFEAQEPEGGAVLVFFHPDTREFWAYYTFR